MSDTEDCRPNACALFVGRCRSAYEDAVFSEHPGSDTLPADATHAAIATCDNDSQLVNGGTSIGSQARGIVLPDISGAINDLITARNEEWAVNNNTGLNAVWDGLITANQAIDAGKNEVRDIVQRLDSVVDKELAGLKGEMARIEPFCREMIASERRDLGGLVQTAVTNALDAKLPARDKAFEDHFETMRQKMEGLNLRVNECQNAVKNLKGGGGRQNRVNKQAQQQRTSPWPSAQPAQPAAAPPRPSNNERIKALEDENETLRRKITALDTGMEQLRAKNATTDSAILRITEQLYRLDNLTRRMDKFLKRTRKPRPQPQNSADSAATEPSPST